MYKYTYSCSNYSYNYMYQYSYFCMYDPNINTHKYSYKCIYVLSSDKSPLRLVVNKKSSKTLSAF